MTSPARIQSAIATEPFAFALVQWPALIGVLALEGDGWALAARVVLGVWVAVLVLAAYSRRRGPGFGNIMLLLLGCVYAAWSAYPSGWVLAWLAPLLVGLGAAQQALCRRNPPEGHPHGVEHCTR